MKGRGGVSGVGKREGDGGEEGKGRKRGVFDDKKLKRPE